jgi:hypothetical protein
MRYLVLLLVLTSGCDFDFFLDDNASNSGGGDTGANTAVGLLVKTPDLSAASGMSTSLASYLPLSALSNRNATAGVLMLGAVSGSRFTGVTGAEVSLSFASTSVDLCDNNNGTYSGTSVSGSTCADTSLKYANSATYTFAARTSVGTYTLSVDAPTPIAADDIALTPALATAVNAHGATLRGHTANADLDLDWSAGTDTSAFVTVSRINYTGYAGAAFDANSWSAEEDNPVYSNIPNSIEAYSDLLTDDAVTTLEIPGETFDRQGLYFVTITPIAVSTEADGLEDGSGAIAGVGTALAFWVD